MCWSRGARRSLSSECLRSPSDSAFSQLSCCTTEPSEPCPSSGESCRCESSSLQCSRANRVSDNPYIQQIRTALNKFSKIRIYRNLLCTHTQCLQSTEIFLVEEGLFVTGYFWHGEKAQSRVGKDQQILINLRL